MATSLTLSNQPLKQVMEITYLGVVLTDDLASAKDVEQARIPFFKQFKSIYHNFVLLMKMYCWFFSDYAQRKFFVLKPGIRSLKEYLKIISVPHFKAIKRICGRNSYDSNHECFEQVNLPIF